MKNSLLALVLAGSQAVLAQPKSIPTIDLSKVPLCSEVQRKVDSTLDDEQILSRLSQYIPNIREAPFKDEALRLFRLAKETGPKECTIFPKDHPSIPSRIFLLVSAMAW